MMPNRRANHSEMRNQHDMYDMKYGQPMIMHIPKSRGLHVKDINIRTRNAFHSTLRTLNNQTNDWAGGRKDMPPLKFTKNNKCIVPHKNQSEAFAHLDTNIKSYLTSTQKAFCKFFIL
jgi:hypothetical protein